MANSEKLDKILRQLEQASALEDLFRVVYAIRDVFAISHVVYHWVDAKGDQYGCGTYSLEWADRYLARNYLRVDPVITGCFQRFHPVDWKRLDWTSRSAREFMADAKAHGVGDQGYSIPIRGPSGQFALFSANHSCDDATWAAFTEEHSRDLILLAHYMNRKALELEPNRAPEQSRQLSPREIDAMTLLAMGYNRAQVAESLAISEHTLRVYIESARFKLGALNTTHAVARAIGCGLIVV